MLKSPAQSMLAYLPLILVLMLAAVWVGLSRGQDTAPAQPTAPGGVAAGRGGGDGQAAEIRNHIKDALKSDLAPVSDEEWAAIEGKIEKVLETQSTARGLAYGRSGGRPELSKALDDLRQTLNNKDATNDEIKTKVDALLAAREKAKAEASKAQADLRKSLNVRQEAILIADGLLE